MSKTATKRAPHPLAPSPEERGGKEKAPESMGEIHRRIDTARDVLVGKVPDPKSQVEQITLALIYKFMDDMDDRSVEMGGGPSFFKGDAARFAWKKLFDPRLGSADMLKLYDEAISSFSASKNLPELFRNIYKNAYLPYRDPETLKLFLKTINGFHYDHSERLGDAFEYLLSVLGSQGDAGQFRTPRHIIDFIVKVVDPGKDDKILDPACGTAGFLISAFKHVSHPHTFEHASKSGDLRKVVRLNTQERAQLMQNIIGYDISPDMVRLSLVNLYLHDFKAPQVMEYDALTSDDYWNDYYDVILANPPFMSPKGGIKPHKRFGVQSNRSEVLFVDYIAEHLTPTGRAGIIVPEGIIFQSGTAYKALRKMLVEKYLWAVVSLPAGVFNPYSGVKTSILFLDRARAEKSDSVLFVKVQADGFDLGAQRRPNGKDDLPAALATLTLTPSPSPEGRGEQDGNSLTVSKEKIAASGDYNLSIDRYQPSKQQHSGKWPMVKLGEICTFEYGKPLKEENRKDGPYPVYGSNGPVGLHNEYLVEAPFIVVGRKGSAGALFYSEENGTPIDTTFFIKPETEDRYLLKYLFYALEKLDLKNLNTQAGVPGLNRNDACELKIPLPPLEVQREIVAEIEGYRRVLDGAKQVVENWKPNVEFWLKKFAEEEPWPVVKLGEVCEKITDGDHQPPPKSPNGVPFITISNISRQYEIDFSDTFFVSEDYYARIDISKRPRKGDVLYTVTGSFGIPVLLTDERKFCFQRHIGLIRAGKNLGASYLFWLLASPSLFQQAEDSATGVAQKTVSLSALRNFDIPLPPLDVQQAIVAEIEKERALVEASRQLAAAMQVKIKTVVERVWGA